MNWPAIRTVFFKEMREFLRDRRALFAGVVLPILMYPVLTIFMTLLVGSQINKLTNDDYVIGVAPADRLDDVKSWYREKCAAEAAPFKLPAANPATTPTPPSPDAPTDPAPPTAEPAAPAEAPVTTDEPSDAAPPSPTNTGVRLEFVAVDSQSAPRKIASKELKAVILFEDLALTPPPPASDHPDDNSDLIRPTGFGDNRETIRVLKESADIRSRTAASYAVSLLEYHRQQVIRAKLRELGGDPDQILDPFHIDRFADISSSDDKGGALFGGIVPFMLVIMLIGAASYPAIDVTTGERERGTMETLLIAPVRARDLVSGKFLAVFTMAVIACLLNVLSLGFSMYFGGMGIAQQLDFTIPWMALPWLLVLLLPLAILFSALLMLAGSFAASTKEAQTYLTPVIMLAMFPSMLAMVPGIELEGGWLFLPVGNVTLLSRDLLSGQLPFPEGLGTIAVVLGSTWLYAASVVGMAGALFGREEVLYGEKPWRVLLNRNRLKERANPTPWEALFIAACALPIFIYASLMFTGLMTSAGPLWANVPAQFAAILGWPLLYAWRSKSRLRTTFGVLPPTPAARLALLPVLIAGAYLLAHLVAITTQALLPSEFGSDQMSQLILQEVQAWPLGAMLFMVAVTPALCEELLFRGFLMRALEKPFGVRWAIVVQAAAFAIFHVSLQRLPYTFVLGVILGVVAWRTRSVIPGMLIHLCLNGLSIWIAYPSGKAVERFLENAFQPEHIVYTCLAAGALTAAGFLPMFLFGNKPPAPTHPEDFPPTPGTWDEAAKP